MWDYEIVTALKSQTLKTNGIYTIDRDDEKFIQHNDYFEHKTFFQCPRCKSLNVDAERAYGSNGPVVIVRSCDDCGYQHTTDLTKGGKIND
ncbi:hypothetical protein [Staphylococcus carnosus]|uniref:hypothetical protein n=1 Tax=Staphylococcus carnosus TaxID=1281 RepID=UPI0005A21720|nr:hypothetical protein [Staphylococcus carnosus]QPT03581.1 hypothetical protein I6G40_10935 [Staphylococcus carnosus]UQA66304.1 hypothetical protein Sta3580_06970 [Staphylococcus carnosus]UTB78857.1 hypothetical protein A2I62_09950 [Staphylococcus carnosus]UTB88410.1 hypothetical protein A2I63_09950 [Staphylococcus carnosus]UTB90758.1 hypothetical protein A2I64_09945 [Staphylococcus carnosus]